jgi:hypothetical protein
MADDPNAVAALLTSAVLSEVHPQLADLGPFRCTADTERFHPRPDTRRRAGEERSPGSSSTTSESRLMISGTEKIS